MDWTIRIPRSDLIAAIRLGPAGFVGGLDHPHLTSRFDHHAGAQFHVGRIGPETPGCRVGNGVEGKQTGGVDGISKIRRGQGKETGDQRQGNYQVAGRQSEMEGRGRDRQADRGQEQFGPQPDKQDHQEKGDQRPAFLSQLFGEIKHRPARNPCSDFGFGRCRTGRQRAKACRVGGRIGRGERDRSRPRRPR